MENNKPTTSFRTIRPVLSFDTELNGDDVNRKSVPAAIVRKSIAAASCR
jgi:hypothetical protein